MAKKTTQKKSSSIASGIGKSVEGVVKKTTRTAQKTAASTQDYSQQIGPEMDAAIGQAARRSVANKYNAAAETLSRFAGNNALSYQDQQTYSTALNDLSSAIKSGMPLGIFQFESARDMEDFRRYYQSVMNEASRVKKLSALREEDYNTQYLFPTKFSGVSGAAGATDSLNALKRTMGAQRQRGGKVSASTQAEYDWLSQHQYDYWSQDELKQGIASTESAVQAASSDLKHYSDYSYRTKNWDWQTKSNAAEKRRAGAQQTLDAMRAAKETNAYRDVLSKMSGADLDNLQKLASLSDTQARIRSSAVLPTALQNEWAAQSLQMQAAQYSDEIEQLKDSLRRKGYTEAQILSLTDYVIRQQHQEQRMSEMQQLVDWTKQNFWTKAAGSALSVPINLMGGVGYLDLAAQNAFAGTDAITGDRKRIDQYSDLTAFSDYSSTIRGAVGEDMGWFGNFLYQTGMSMADFLAAAPTGNAATVLLGGSAAMQATRDAYARGANDLQALAVGGFAGAAEAVFEEFSLGKLKALQTSEKAARRTFGEILKEIGKQGLVEGSEEGFTTIANTLTDAWVMGDKSALNTAIRDYMAQGMSEEEATRRAYLDWLEQLAMDVAGGALSGGVMGGGAAMLSNGRISSANRQLGQRVIANDYTGTLREYAAAMPEGSRAQQITGKLDSAKGRKAARLTGELYNEVQHGGMQQAIQTRLQELGVRENAAETAQAILKQQAGETVSQRENALLNTRAAQRTATEYADAMKGREGSNGWAYDALRGIDAMDAAALTEERADGRMVSAPTGEAESPATVEAFAERYGEQAGAVVEAYHEGQDVESFATSFDAAYEAGREGAELEAIRDHNAMRGLEPEQVEIAWMMGKEAAKESGASGGRITTPSATARNESIDLKGDTTNGGEAVHLRGGGERTDGARTVGQISRVAEAAGRDQAGKKGDNRPADRQALKVSVGEKISALRLGVKNGATAQTVYTVTGNDTKIMKKARALAAEHGMKVVFFAGGNLGVHTRADNLHYVASARGLVQGDTVYVRVDHAQFTADQIMRHEMGHKEIENGEIDLNEVRERVRKEFGEEQFDAIVQLYLDAYDGTELTADEIWEEIVCDSLGDMNVFSDTFEGLQRKTGKLLRATKKTANELRGEKREQESRAPPESVQAKFSRDYDPETASIKEQIRNSEYLLNSMTPVANLTVPETFSSKKDAAKWAIGLLKRTGYQVDRQGYGVIRFDEKDINYGVNYADTIGEQAALAALPHVLKRGIEIGKHQNHKTRKKRTVTFAAPVVLNGTRGNMAVVVNMANDRYYSHRIVLPDGTAFVFSTNKKDAAQEPHRGVTDNGSLADATSAASDNSISDSSRKSNPKTSRDLDTRYTAAVEAGDTQAAQRMVDEAARKAGYTVRAYHGTPNGTFNVFREWQYFTENKEYADRYQNQGASSNGYKPTATRPRTYDVYLKLENTFDTRKPRDRKIFNEEFYRQWGNGAPLSERGLPDWTDGDDFAEFFDENGYDYDSIYLDEGGTGGYGEEVQDRGISIAVKDPSQIKSAEPIVYNDNGDVIPLSRRFDSSEPDIRLSQDLESLADLRRENRELRERAKKWRRETLRSKGRETVRAEDVKAAAKSLIADMHSTIRPSEITGDLTSLAEYMMRGEGKNERTPAWTEIKERAGEIAEKLVDSAETMREGGDPELYNDMKRYVRETKMTIADEDKGDIPNGYEYFRRQNVGILRLGKDGLPVDSAYEQLQDAYGKGFFPDEITHPADQLMRIADVISGLKPVYENPHSYNRAEAVEWASNAIIDTLLSEDVRQAAPTYADKQAAKYDAYVRRSHAAIKRVREQRDRQIAKIRQEHREQKVRARERKTRSEMWRGILALKKDFQRMVDKPEKSNSRHAPMGLAIALRNVADCFDREGRTSNGKVKLPEFKEAVVRLRDEYEGMKDDGALGFYFDPVVMERLAAVNQELRDVTDATTLTTGQLRQIYDALRMCKHGITTANKFIALEYSTGIMEAGRQWGGEVMRASPLLKGIGGQLLNYQLRPDSFFARISGFAKNSVGEMVQKMFVEGTERMLRIQQDFYYTFEKFSTDKRFDALTKRGKSMVDVGLKDQDGNTVKLTRDQMLAVYMHLRSEDNLRAAAYGGLDVPNAKAYYTGNVAQSFDRSVRTACIDASTVDLLDEQRQLQKLAREDEARGEIHPEVTQRLDEIRAELQAAEGEMIGMLLDVRAEIEKQLTDFEKELVEAADTWMQKSADYINTETLAMYGIEKANVEHYWTIHRNTNFVNTDMRTAVDEINLENWGSLKERVQSHAPVKLTGFVFELDNHTKKMSQFCGFAAVQRDFNKLYNTRLPGQHTSLSEQVQKKFGSGEKKLGVSGQEYIDNYIKSISGGEHVKPSPIAWFRMNLPRATLSANFRVALSQVASVPTAAAEVGWGAMAKGFARYSVKGLSAKQQEQLARTDPWFWQRSRGEGGMREFAEMKESTLAFDRAYNRVAGTKVGKAILNWCQRFDMYATYTQWAMAEEWVKSNRKDLEKDSDAWNEAVSHKYRDIIRKTQPNYTVTERSDLLRDNREVMKWATMYKTQSNQNLNILYEATARLRAYTRDFKNGKNGVTEADLKDARQEFARAYSGVVIGGTLAFALFRTVANAFQHCMNAYRDDDDELTLPSILTGLGKEVLGALSGMFLLGSEIEAIIVAAVTHSKYWGLSDSAISALSDVLENTVNVIQKAFDDDKDLTRDDWTKLLNSLMAPLGIPGKNIAQIVNGVYLHYIDIRNGDFLRFEAGVNRSAAQNANRFMDAFEKGDTEKMQRVYDEMVESSGAKEPEKATQTALRKQIRAAFLSEGGDGISEKQALELLEQYGGKSGKDADKQLQEWKFEKTYGIAYGDLKEAYLNGEVDAEQYISARVEYGGKSREEAQKDEMKLRCEKDTGVEYGESSVVEAAVNGDISTQEAYDIWMKYGGLSEKEAQSRRDHLQFVVDHPDTAYEDVSQKAVEGFYTYGDPANISAGDFMEHFTQMDGYTADVDANGNTITNSKKQKVVDYINSLPISGEQKTALYLAYGYSKSKIPTWS